MKNCTVALDQELYARVSKCAIRHGLSLDSLASAALTEWLSEWEEELPGDATLNDMRASHRTSREARQTKRRLTPVNVIPFPATSA